MRRLSCLAMCALFAIAAPAHAVTGNEYRTFSSVERLAWILGMVDGMLTAQVILTNKKPPLADCLAKFQPQQIRAMFEKALDNEPQLWHFPAGYAFHSAFQKYCGLE
jgi:hypothetical protein